MFPAVAMLYGNLKIQRHVVTILDKRLHREHVTTTNLDQYKEHLLADGHCTEFDVIDGSLKGNPK